MVVSIKNSGIETRLEKAINLFAEDFQNYSQKYSQKLSELKTLLQGANSANTKLDYYKWLDFDYLKAVNKKTIDLANKIKAKNHFVNYLVVGMGGSGINALVLKNIFYDFKIAEQKKNFLIQSNLDTSSMLGRLNDIKRTLDKTLFIVISKSGGTDEVRRNLQTIIDFYQANDPSFTYQKLAQQLVIITEPEVDSKKNFLHQLKNELKEKTSEEIAYLENDPNIGGRFSMFSPVGMLAAELMDISSEALIAGAEMAFNNFIEAEVNQNNIYRLAILDLLLVSKNYYARYSMVYSDALEALNKFRAQLKGESLNKNSIESTVHIPGTGTANHHSDLELLLKDNNGVVLEQIFFAKPAQDHINKAGLDCLKDLVGQSNHQSLIANHINPLYDYISSKGAPVIQTIITKLDAQTLGEFCMQDMLVTIVQAGLQDAIGKKEKLDLVIRQWEVERYKSSLKK